MAWLDTGGARKKKAGKKKKTGGIGSGLGLGGGAGSGVGKGLRVNRRSSGGGGGGYGGGYGGGGGYSGGGYGGGGGKSNSSGHYATPPPPAPKVPIPSINAFLGKDTGYQQQLRQFTKTLADFNADATRRKGSLQTEYGLSTKAMGDQKVKDLDMLLEDFGSRGLLRSGLYGEAVGDYTSEFNKRMTDLSRRQNEALSMLTQEQSQFKNQQKLQQQAAKEAAIRRRAEQYGL